VAKERTFADENHFTLRDESGLADQPAGGLVG